MKAKLMPRYVQSRGTKGSLRWIQLAVNESWASLDAPILAKLPRANRISWLSPLQDDDFAEYRDGEFLDLLGHSELRPVLKDFWPERGPQWDALGLSDGGQAILVEAKAHLGEMCSPGTSAGPVSRERIERALDACADRLKARTTRGAWTDHFYQLANRIAHLQFLRDHGVDAYLVLVNFVNDAERKGPATVEAWEAAYSVAFHVMGLPKRHALSSYIIEVFPDVVACAAGQPPPNS